MNSDSAKKLLDIQIENAFRILDAGFGVNQAEAVFFDIVRLLHEECVLKQYFLERVNITFSFPDVGSLIPGMVPGDLIELIAHEFRWVEFLDLADKRIRVFFSGNAVLAVGDVSHRVTEAFRDDWPDREFYRHYK